MTSWGSPKYDGPHSRWRDALSFLPIILIACGCMILLAYRIQW